MRITFVGSSHGVPEPNRHCSCNLIEVGENIYFIDMGTMGTEAIIDRGLSMEAVKGIFVTHMHGDHTNGLPGFIELIGWYFHGCNPTVMLPREDAPDVIKSWMKLNNVNCRDEIKFGTTKSGLVYDDGTIRVTAFKTKHLEPSYSYLIEAEGKNIVFTGDLRGPDVDFPDFACDRPIDLIVCEAAHFDATKYADVFKNKCQEIRSVVVNHHSPWHFAEILSLRDMMAPTPVRYGMDGMEINL